MGDIALSDGDTGFSPASALREQTFRFFFLQNLDFRADVSFFRVFIQLYMRNNSGFRVGVSCARAACGAAPAGITPGILVNYPHLEKVAENFKYLFFTDISLKFSGTPKEQSRCLACHPTDQLCR